MRARILLLGLLLGPPSAVAQQPPAGPPAAGTLTKPPAVLQFVEAPFPPSEVGRTAAVVLAVTIAADGHVEEVTVQQSAGEAFDAAAIEALKQFVFSPAEIDGKPSRIRILYSYEFIEKIELPKTAVFEGTVLDRETKAALPGVTVSIGEGDAMREAVTDSAGRFRFEDVSPGTYVVTLQGERLTAIQTEESLAAGDQLDASYEVFLAEEGEEADDLEIIVEAPEIKRSAVVTEVSAEEARKVPGTQGDVLRVVENMPGVARASLGTGALVVWGAAPEDTGVYVDGVPVPRLYHDGGLRSVVGSDFVKSVTLAPGGYGSAYGRGLGGLVSVSTQRFEEPGLHGSASADLYDASGSLRGRVGERLTLAGGARYGYVGPLLSAFSPDVEDVFPIPNYTDTQGRVGLSLRPGEALDLTWLTSSDATRKTALSPDPARTASEERTLSFQRLWMRYERDLGDGSTAEAVLFGGADQSGLVASFGLVETDITSDVTLGGLRASYRSRISGLLTLEGGFDSLVTQTDVSRSGSLGLPAREGDIRVFGQPPPDQISSDSFRVVTLSAAPYTEADLGLLRSEGDGGEARAHITFGLRFDPYARSVSRAAPQVGLSPTSGLFLSDPTLEPRLALRLEPAPWATLTAATGRYSQLPQASDLSASFGNPALPASHASHQLLGAALRPAEPLTVELTLFRTASDGLAMRSAAEQPASAEALVASGSGRSYGLQAMARLDRPKRPVAEGEEPDDSGPYGWLSYTLARSERKNNDSAPWRPSDYDQRHVLTALGGFAWRAGFEIGVRLRLATGFPRTAVTGALYDSRRDLYQPLFGPQNELRLPAFFQADLRAAQHVEIAGTDLDLSLEIQNLTDRDNVEELVYNTDYTTRGAIRGLPILPVAGARWSF